MLPNNIIDHQGQLNQLRETIKKNQDFVNKFNKELFVEKEESPTIDPLRENIQNREFI